ncbi:NAD-dependent malic enzyme [Desulfotomaculum copahuensis]|uniref:Malate dehydrogenase n=1 Tax=Desulfotomaculum copahuensis TaxID=1838280 RepID=A0A1B7LGF2_9FIRM|nr:NAD-dependent malic enzyme [Desulfotomaculum copahuensis]OAT84994.1 malate dehydrogenase [Desulfotomaculum copahuensis]
MVMPANVLIQLKLENKPGTLAKILTAIGEYGGNVGSIDLVSASPGYMVRDIMVGMHESQQLMPLLEKLNSFPEAKVLHVADRVFLAHRGGKIQVTPKRQILNREDLSLVYTPGVARVSQAIAKNPEYAYDLTMKGNSVAIVTDGSAVLGLGNLGARAALPVMEGKAVLFKQFGNVDAIPVCLDVHEPGDIIAAVIAIAPQFGGINLEDIAAPKCFDIEERLTGLLDIPVFHDDQHGTAIVVLAGLLNALKIVNKKISDVEIVLSGAGAAGVAIAKILLDAGARNIVVCDRQGAISLARNLSVPSKRWLAEHTNPQNKNGSLKEVIKGADVLIGVSGPGLLHREDILGMAPRPVVFALANPVPEVEPEEVYDVAGVLATGRSDYPNQINNVLAFPGVFRGALDCHARAINGEMALAAAHALAGIVRPGELSADNIIPAVFNRDVTPKVARAVKEAAIKSGLSRRINHFKESIK